MSTMDMGLDHLFSGLGGGGVVLSVISVLWKLSNKRTDQLFKSKDETIQKQDETIQRLEESNKRLEEGRNEKYERVVSLEKEKDAIEKEKFELVLNDLRQIKNTRILNGGAEEMQRDLKDIKEAVIKK